MENIFSVENLTAAYRKAKRDAFHGNTSAMGLKIAEYEKNLEENLILLSELLTDSNNEWCHNIEFIGGRQLMLRSVDQAPDPNLPKHISLGDPWLDWNSRNTPHRKANARLRQVIDPTVNFLIVSTLWSIKIGDKFDALLDKSNVYGNRIKRRFRKEEINNDAKDLFENYSFKYGEWKKDGINAVKNALMRNGNVVCVSMDVKSFYDKIDPRFIMNSKFNLISKVSLSNEEWQFTEKIIHAKISWSNVHSLEGDIGLPIGIPSSAIMANVFLLQFDREIERIEPLFYGRYVDDVFLVFQAKTNIRLADSIMRFLSTEVSCLHYDGKEISANFDYGMESQIIFGPEKQRIFVLRGASGFDLIRPLEEQLRLNSSERRLMPVLPSSENKMARKAFLTSNNARISTDIFREADVVALRRAGFQEMLSTAEKVSNVLEPHTWSKKRNFFYDICFRHVICPMGTFDYFLYFSRIACLMAGNADWRQLEKLIDQVAKVKRNFFGRVDLPRGHIQESFNGIASRIILGILRARWDDSNADKVTKCIRRVRKIGQIDIGRITEKSIVSRRRQLYYADWSVRPLYHELIDEIGENSSPVAILEEIRVGIKIDSLENAFAILGWPKFTKRNWKGACFPTRDIPLSEISQAVGWSEIVGSNEYIENKKPLPRLYLDITGKRLPPQLHPEVFENDEGEPIGVRLGREHTPVVSIAVPSFGVEKSDWDSAALCSPNHSYKRFEELNELVNDVLRGKVRPDYLILPELSIPYKFFELLEPKLAANGIGLICGVEYMQSRINPNVLENICMISIPVNQGSGSFRFRQVKSRPSWGEEEEVHTVTKGIRTVFANSHVKFPVYDHNGFSFGVLICSDVSSMEMRKRFLGEVDALFLVEWNSDTKTFGSIVEAAASDLHAYVIQANVRKFGDSRIRGPLKKDYARDVIQVKGGDQNFFVVGKLEIEKLRKYQSVRPDTSENAAFKPYPVDYVVSPRRKIP